MVAALFGPLRARGPLAGRLLVVAVTAAVGFLAVSQVRGQERFTQRLEAESEGDLARILASLAEEADALRDEIATLKLQLLDLRNSTARDDAAERAAEERLRALQVLAGTVAVTGPGVFVRMDDPAGSLTYDLLIDLVQELRDAGAEAVAVNGRRVGATSAFGERAGGILLDGASLAQPYVVAAIGQPATLDGALAIPGGAVDTLSASAGVKVSVQRAAQVSLGALDRPPSFDAARPVASEE